MTLERARRRRASVLGISLALGLALTSIVAGPVAAANNVIVTAFFGDCQFEGRNAGANKTVKIEWRDSDSNLKTKHSVTSNSTGRFTSRCEPDELMEAGDVLKTTIGTSSRSFTVPKVTANVDRDANTVSGKVAPAPSVLTVELFTYEGGFDPAGGLWHVSTPIPNGTDYATASWDVAPDIRGWDDVYVEWQNARGDTAIRYVVAQGVRVWMRQQFFQVVGNPGSLFSLDLLDDSLVLLSTESGRLNRDGRWSGDFLDAEGNPIRVGSLYRVLWQTPTGSSINTRAIIATINKTTDRITAYCGEQSGVEVAIHPRDYATIQVRVGMTDDNNSMLANFAVAPKYDVKSGDKVDVYCKRDTGDIVARTFTVQ